MFLAPLTGALLPRDLETIREILRREFAAYPLVSPFLALEERIMRVMRPES